jgi:hypothetical protein
MAAIKFTDAGDTTRDARFVGREFGTGGEDGGYGGACGVAGDRAGVAGLGTDGRGGGEAAGAGAVGELGKGDKACAAVLEFRRAGSVYLYISISTN